MNRREFCKTTSALALAVLAGKSLLADEPKLLSSDEIIAKYTKGKSAKQSLVSLLAPEIAENGMVVPLKVSVDMAASDPRFPKNIYLIAPLNPAPLICSMSLSKRNGKAFMATRAKLAKSQEVIALVELGDGSFVLDKKPVKVTIGGCG